MGIQEKYLIDNGVPYVKDSTGTICVSINLLIDMGLFSEWHRISYEIQNGIKKPTV
jgi:hypothetical protein